MMSLRSSGSYPFYFILLVLCSTTFCHGFVLPFLSTRLAQQPLGFDTGAGAPKTFIFTNLHWWESVDHQLTTIATLLALAQNTSSVAVVPQFPSKESSLSSNKSLLGDFFDISAVKRLQPVMTLAEFMRTNEYQQLKAEETGSIPFPKLSQEEYEARLKVFGHLETTQVALAMPSIDPENTSQRCDRYGGTMHLSSDGKTRFIFLDRIHFLHFCTEKFMPWWYTIRHRISPRKPFVDIANRYVAKSTRPLTVIHVNDVLEHQKEREDEEIERYARQIVDSLRNNQAISGTLYIISAKQGKNVNKVISLLREEFETIHDCSQIYNCMSEVPRDIMFGTLSDEEYQTLFKSEESLKILEWTLGSQADLFIGNIYSPFSRNICLHRKLHGMGYSALKGFSELRKVWSWNLLG
ncbi:unnamed protein product [Agarophyton chilense]